MGKYNVSLLLLSRYHEELKDSLLGKGLQAKGFKEHIRQYNSANISSNWMSAKEMTISMGKYIYWKGSSSGK